MYDRGEKAYKFKFARLFVAVAALLLGLVAAGAAYYFCPTPTIPAGETVTKIVVEKGRRRLSAMNGDKVLVSYVVSLRREPKGPKQCQGDNRTPEGTYLLGAVNSASLFHRSLPVSYPSAKDHCPDGRGSGGDIMVHGVPNRYPWLRRFHRFVDWTQNCIALTNEKIDKLTQVVRPGTPIEIRP